MVKITPADSAFSKCVRERTDYTCEKCGKQYDRSSTGLHASHFHGRGHYSVRFDPDNVFSHCYSCHLNFGANPHDFTQWAIKQLGETRYEILLEKKNNTNIGKEIKRLAKKGEVAKHYREQHKSLVSLRDNGKTGRIEFIGF